MSLHLINNIEIPMSFYHSTSWI